MSLMAILSAVRLFLGRIPPWGWYVIIGAVAVFGLWRWHDGKVRAAYASGATLQKAADSAAYAKAAKEAFDRQHALVAALDARQTAISKGTEDALIARNTELARSYDDLRLRWTAYRADPGRTGQGGATAVSGAAGIPDDAACAARGWVAFDTAAAAAEAADTAIAKDDAWIAWAAAQAKAWPAQPVPAIPAVTPPGG